MIIVKISEMRRFLVDSRSLPQPQPQDPQPNDEDEPNMANDDEEDVFNPDEIVCDPAIRKQIDDYHPDVQDQVRRAYILKGPTQPVVNFPRKQFGCLSRAFSKDWYKKYDWIEYSESQDAAYCFYCFLFKKSENNQRFGSEVFTRSGFSDWKHAYKALPHHIGGVRSDHNNARLHCDDFHNQRQSVSSKLSCATKESEELYKIRLTSSLECTRFLISQGMAFRGHDESSTSLNKGNFCEMIDWYKDKNEKVRHAFDRGPKNCKMLAPEIQKDLAKCCTQEVTDVIMREIGDRQFFVLIDE